MRRVSVSSVYSKDLDMYQVLPQLYIGHFDGFLGDKLIKQKWVLNLENQSEKIVWECIETRIKLMILTN